LISTYLADRLKQKAGHNVWINIRAGSTILEIPTTILRNVKGNSDGSASIAHAPAKIFVGAGLVMTGEALLDAVTVVGDVPAVTAAETLARCLDVIHPALLTHLPGREIRVSASAVELGHRLRVELRNDPVLLTESVEDPTREDKVISDRESVGGPDLKLPLAGHHLGVHTADRDSRIKASSQVLLDKITTEDLIGSHTAVERALLGRITSHGPAEWLAVFEESVLLLDTEEGIMIESLRDNITESYAGVRSVWSSVGVEHLAKNKDVNSFMILLPGRIKDHAHGNQHTIASIS
jgi:hypothetical protein